MDCPHYLYDKSQVVGRIARCYNEVCDNTIKISFADLQKAKITCGQCIEALPVEGISDILELIPKREEEKVVDTKSSLEEIVREALQSAEQKGE